MKTEAGKREEVTGNKAVAGAFVPGAQDIAQLLDALDTIAERPDYDSKIGLTLDQVAREYDAVREIARLALACWERAERLAKSEVSHG